MNTKKDTSVWWCCIQVSRCKMKSFLLIVLVCCAAARAFEMPPPAEDIESVRGDMTDYVHDVDYKDNDPRAPELVAALNAIASAADAATKNKQQWFEVVFVVRSLNDKDVADIWRALGERHVQYITMSEETSFGTLYVSYVYLRKAIPSKCAHGEYVVSWSQDTIETSIDVASNLVCKDYLAKGAFVDVVMSKIDAGDANIDDVNIRAKSVFKQSVRNFVPSADR